jgi:predicted O-methyltransferase YrrM
MTSLNDYLISKKISVTEGNINAVTKQQTEITEILKTKDKEKGKDNNNDFKYIMEIGFNAGHSSELFLKNTNAYVYSFDIGDHFNHYLKYGKHYINYVYPNRHTLVFGDSKMTVPRFAANNDIKFDLIFIDGGHDYETAYADLLNCRNLAHSETIVIMDDITINPIFKTHWSIGPTKAWSEIIKLNLLHEISHSEYNLLGRGQSVGKYIL